MAITVLNAADFGVPQKRERMIMVGFRSDVDVGWSFPAPTHGQEALLWDQWVSGSYWDRHGVATSGRPELAASLRRRVERLRGFDFPPLQQPWRTVRDALHDLPDPETQAADSARIPDHRFNPGARPYPGHTGSKYDEPAKVLKAGDHGVPGGENMLARDDGTCRYFSVREAARLQTFPDSYRFPGSWTETMRQIGNAVPVVLGQVLARGIRECLEASAQSPSLHAWQVVEGRCQAESHGDAGDPATIQADTFSGLRSRTLMTKRPIGHVTTNSRTPTVPHTNSIR